jgi:protein gp37
VALCLIEDQPRVSNYFGARERHPHRMQIEWVREIFRACRRANVPFFFKQWGGVRKDLTGRQLRGKTYDEMPAVLAA